MHDSKNLLHVQPEHTFKVISVCKDDGEKITGEKQGVSLKFKTKKK